MHMQECRLCPRQCGVNRTTQLGVCGQGSEVQLARAALHFWEEPPISGEAGSGTVFFSGCPLQCVYCQNKEIAHGDVGKAVTVERLAQIFLEQQARGALNINLVTPTHFTPQIREALDLARSVEFASSYTLNGNLNAQSCTTTSSLREQSCKPSSNAHAESCKPLNLPIVYNTSGYELVDEIQKLDGYVDVFLTDFKYASPEVAKRYSNAPDYPEIADKALDAMYKLVGSLQYEIMSDGEERLVRGIIVRHLLLPGYLEDSKHVLNILASKAYKDDIIISIMNQFTPSDDLTNEYSEINRVVTDEEYDALIDYALELGFANIFMQEGETASESFIPAFDYEGI